MKTIRKAKLAIPVNAHITLVQRCFDSRRMSSMVATNMFQSIANEELRTAVRELNTIVSILANGSRVI